MNLILFARAEDACVIRYTDPRYTHIRQVLKLTAGDTVFVGLINGPRGKATITQMNAAIHLAVEWEGIPLQPYPIDLIVGLPRPQTARKILQDCTGLGVRRICFFQPEKGERSYRQSKLWQTDEWRRHLWQGAEQAFNTTIPEVIHVDALHDCLQHGNVTSPNVPSPGTCKWALDVYEAPCSFAERLCPNPLQNGGEALLAIGPERGWSAAERDCLRTQQFELLHLGERVLRTETACILAVGMVAGALGYKRYRSSEQN